MIPFRVDIERAEAVNWTRRCNKSSVEYNLWKTAYIFSEIPKRSALLRLDEFKYISYPDDVSEFQQKERIFPTDTDKYFGAFPTLWCELFISCEVFLGEAIRNSTEVSMNFEAFLQVEQFDRGESAEGSDAHSDAQKYCRKRSRHFFEFLARGSEKVLYDSLSMASRIT